MINIKTLKKDDLQKLIELIKLYEDVFEMKDFIIPSHEYLQSLLDNDEISFLVAEKDGKIVGGLTAHDLPSTYFEANEVYVYDLAVAKQYQCKGIGKKLLSELEKICREKGESEFFLQADIDESHALDFYRSTGGVPENVIHFSYDTKN